MENLIFHMGFTDRGLIWNWIRGLFSWFDYIIYTILGWFFQTIFYVANFQMNILYEEIQARVYVILGIFMLFKLVMSFLTYLVNPDKISDKEQGVGKLVTRVILVLVMFIALPTLFTVMTDLQNRLIPVIPRIVIGQAAGGDFFTEDSKTGVTTMDVSGLGDSMALSVYRAFLRTNTSSECGAPAETDTNDPTVSLWVDIDDAVAHINDPCPNSDDLYLYKYTPIVPFVVGIIMVVVVLGINIDVGIRSFKLLILRAIAPIPILSYIDPKSSKDGAFSKWTKMLFSTWISLFVNLAIVYLVIYLIQMLFRADVWSNFFGNFTSTNPVINALVLILVVIALLFFAREAPQFILDALGIKSAGTFGKMLGVAAAGLGMAGSARASYQASRDADDALGRNHNLLRNVGAGLFGGISGGMAGAHAALSAKDGHSKAAMDAMMKRNSRVTSAGTDGGTTLGGISSYMSTLMSGQSGVERMEAEWKAEEEAIKYEKQKNAERKTIMDRASSKGLESLKTSANISGFSGVSGRTYDFSANAAMYNSALESALSGNGTYKMYDNGYGNLITEAEYNSLSDSQKMAFTEEGTYFDYDGQAINMEDAKLLQHEINDGNIADYAEQALAGTIDDSVITGADIRFAEANGGVGVERTFAGSTGLKATYGNENNAITARELAVANQRNSKDVKRQQANDKRFRGNGR